MLYCTLVYNLNLIRRHVPADLSRDGRRHVPVKTGMGTDESRKEYILSDEWAVM